MLFAYILAAFSFIASPALATTMQVTYDTVYDTKSNSLSIVACSDGTNGLLTKGYTTFGSLKAFPRIGGAQAVAGWNSPNCGTCWNLSYSGHNVTVLAIDHAEDGFNISEEAMNTLTNGHAVEYGVVTATVTSLPTSACGL